MTEHMENRRTRGFSLVETLAVVAILAILLSLSAVAAAYYRDYLKITELDNAAREIYMAAENRAVLLDEDSWRRPAGQRPGRLPSGRGRNSGPAHPHHQRGRRRQGTADRRGH